MGSIYTQPQEFSTFDQKAVLKVCGIGGGGGNAVDRMIESGLSGVQFIAINTDAQALKKSKADVRVQIGTGLSGGLGAGARPEMGRQACEEDRERVREAIRGADMVFLTLGLGGGTGTGAAPIVAQEAADSGALTVAIVTLPFSFEGDERMNNALAGLEELEKHVDTLIVVPNDRIIELSHTNTSLLDAFRQGDEVLRDGVRAISELITVPGLINLDFADLRTIMQAKGRALMGIGIAEGEDRAVRAATEAIICPLLEQSDINGAKGVIVNIHGGSELRMREAQEAIAHIKKNASPGANIIFGVVVAEEAREELQVTVIAAGFPRKDVDAYRRDTGRQAAPPAPEAPVRRDVTPAPVSVMTPAPTPPAAPAPLPAAARPQPTAARVETPPQEAKPAPAPAPVAVKPQPKPDVYQKNAEQLTLPTASDTFVTTFNSDDKADGDKEDMDLPPFMTEFRQRRK